ncbi:helix-turn-helix transcriptional regulator [Serinicoccus sp. CUA-874]|uniref:helix-turn-helix transcriptional regulator n=1 Tax=Serinicoccus sp. CUA-874 TaxID=1517939 RepID=UPI001EDA1C15|nr:WYL domain-containing protein [Serinicoccus sp. CUA-874]
MVRDESSVAGIEPLLHTPDPAFEPVRDAVLTRTPITFDYRGGSGDLAHRRVEPWGLTSWHGRWYLTAHDLDREAPRVFRLDRVVGTPKRSGRAGGYAVPDDLDTLAMIRRSAGEDPPSDRTARLLLRDGAAASLRRRGTATTGGDAPEGWSLVDVAAGSWPRLAREVCAAGPDVRVVDPPELATLVADQLRAVVAAHGGQEG